jgi:hypothetical protein
MAGGPSVRDAEVPLLEYTASEEEVDPGTFSNELP